MEGKTATSVLLIDDHRRFRTEVANTLEQEKYRVEPKATIEEAVEYLQDPNNVRPDFILADRMFDGEKIEDGGLQKLAASAKNAFIVVYSRAGDLTDEERYDLLDKGAIRTLDKKTADLLVGDIQLLEHEFEELLTLSRELKSATQERAKIVAALAGSDIAVTVIDRNYHCWFANARQDELVGGPAQGGLCWKLFHNHPVCSGVCWGCTIQQVLKTDKVVERLFLTRYLDGRVRWVSVRSTPIRSEGKVIAAWEGITEASDDMVRAIPQDQRLLRIAQGLVHIGFGQARVYDLRSVNRLKLVAAAARSDNPAHAESAYVGRLGHVSLDYKLCPYAMDALKNKVGLVVDKWRGEPSPFAKFFSYIPPYIMVPVWSVSGSLYGLVCADFVGVKDVVREELIRRYANKETLEWVQSTYADEVREAFDDASRHGPQTRSMLNVVQRAQLSIGTAQSVDEALKALVEAFIGVLPGCTVHVWGLTGEKRNELMEFGALCIEKGKPRALAQNPIKVNAPGALEAMIAQLETPLWLDNCLGDALSAYGQATLLSPLSQGTISAGLIPLRFENVVYGVLRIESPEKVAWVKDGYREALLELARLTALVVRDVILNEKVTTANAEKMAIAAYATRSPMESLWGHWALQQLATIMTKATTARERLPDKHSEIVNALTDIEDELSLLMEGRPSEREMHPRCSMTKVLSDIGRVYRGKKATVVLPVGAEFPEISAPEYVLKHILTILLDNAVYAIEVFRKGTKVEISISRQEGYVTIIVHDDGPGLPESIRAKLFQEAIQSEKGRGLGLLTARGAALRYGGDLRVEPTDTGACFALTLPTAG